MAKTLTLGRLDLTARRTIRGASRWREPPGKDRGNEDGRTGIATKTRPKTKKPSLYKVLLLNDDYTPMEFVVHVLEKYFAKGRDEATRIMLHVHHKGRRHLRGLPLRGRRD